LRGQERGDNKHRNTRPEIPAERETLKQLEVYETESVEFRTSELPVSVDLKKYFYSNFSV